MIKIENEVNRLNFFKRKKLKDKENFVISNINDWEHKQIKSEVKSLLKRGNKNWERS